MDTVTFKFKLGALARDKVSGLEGIITQRVQFMNGCVQYVIKPPAKDGNHPEAYSYDEQQVEVLNDGISEELDIYKKEEAPQRTKTGGPEQITIKSA